MPVSSSYKRMLYKKLIYTAVTRAKKRLIIIGEPMAFMYGIRNNNEIMSFPVTILKYRLTLDF